LAFFLVFFLVSSLLLVFGLDEVGRGALAGPVVAVAVFIDSCKFVPQFVYIRDSKFAHIRDFIKLAHIRHIKDSKKLTPQKREKIYRMIIKNPFIKWGLGKVSSKTIDRINILEATKLAMKKAVDNLNKKYKIKIDKRKSILILDGKMTLDLDFFQKPIVKADEKVFSCTLASIIAKVKRDKMMEKYHKKYPQYGFFKNKGYGVKYHIKMIKKYGPSKIHRRSFYPVSHLT
jgi:ribonuclease HII